MARFNRKRQHQLQMDIADAIDAFVEKHPKTTTRFAMFALLEVTLAIAALEVDADQQRGRK